MLVGAVPSVVALAWSVPQLLGVRAMARRPSRKWFIVQTALLGRVPLLVLVVVTALLSTSHPHLTLALFLLCFALFRSTGGLNTPTYYDLVAVAIHPRVRARFLGLTQFLGGAIGALGLIGGRAALDAFPFPGGFVVCFAVGLALITCNVFFVANVREPPRRIDPGVRPPPLLGASLRTLRQDAALRRYLGGRVLLALGGMATAFYAIHATRNLGARDGDVATFTAILLASQTISALCWGAVADRIQLQPVLFAATVLCGAAAALALVAPTLPWLAVVFVLVGGYTGALAVTDPGLPLALAEGAHADRALYVALANTLLAPFQVAAPLLGGVAADSGGYALAFGLAAALSIAAAALVARSHFQGRNASMLHPVRART